MPSVSLIDPYSQQAEEIARRQRMAQALQESGSQVLDMPTTPGVAISPYAGLAKVFQQMFGAYQDKQARKDYTKLQNEYRKNYNTQLGEMARLISAPEVKGVAGQEFVADKPAVMAPKIEKGFGGYGMPQEVGQYEVSPAVPGQAAVAPVEARPAGYISAADLQKIDIPEVKQLLMAKYLKQFEPERVTLGDNQRLLERTGGGGFKEVVGAAKTPTTATLSPLGRLQAERDAIFATNPKDPRLAAYDNAIAKETKIETTPPTDLARLLAERAALAAKNPNDPNLATYDSLIAKNTQDQSLAFQKEKFEWEKGNQGYKLEKVTNDLGEEVLMAVNSAGIARPVRTGTGEIVKSAPPVKMIRVETEAADGSIKMVLMSEKDQKLKDGIALKGPEYVSITTVNAQGMPEIRQVTKNDPILTTGYVKPLDGFLGQLQAAGVPMDKIRSDPKIRDLVDRYFVKTAGGVAPEDVAGFDLRKAEVVARLSDMGINIPASMKGLGLSVTPGVLGGAQSSNAAPAAPPAPASAALQMPANKNQLVNGQTYQTPKGEMKWNAAANRFEK